MGKNLFGGNADVKVDFLYDNMMGDVNTFALANDNDKLVFYMADQYKDCAELKNLFHWYCQVVKYLKTPAQSEARTKTNNEFRSQANEIYRTKIEPKFRELFDKCVIVSGQQVIEGITIKGKDRYRESLQRHLGEVYTYARLAVGPNVPTTNDAVKSAINRPIQGNEYSELNPLNDAEKLLKQYIERQGVDVVLSDIVSTFQKRPYGWNEFAIIYFVNELVRRRIFEFAYNNNTNIDRSVVAANISREKNKFTVKPARAISAELVNRFCACWKDIFNSPTVPGGNDPVEIFNKCREMIAQKITHENELYTSIAAYPFAQLLQTVVAKLNEWQAIRDYTAFFEKVVQDSDAAKTIMDEGKMVREFCNDQLSNYKACLDFATENEGNWSELDKEAYEVAKEVKLIQTDALPMQKMPVYLRQRRMLNAKLEEVKDNLRKQITAAYKETEQQLIQAAAEQGVTYNSKVDNVIYLKIQPSSIANLKLNLNTDEYYQTEVAKILVQSQPTPQAPADGGSSQTPTQPLPTVKNVRLNTRCASKLSTAQDVDNYLNKLRSQLMSHIDKGEEIIVM
jgi:hypothetical protein